MNFFLVLFCLALFLCLQVVKALRFHIMLSTSYLPSEVSFSTHFISNSLSILLPFRLGHLIRIFMVNSITHKKIYSLLIVLSELFLDALFNLILFYVVFVLIFNATFSVEMKVFLFILLGLTFLIALVPSSFTIIKNLVISTPHDSRLMHLLKPLLLFKTNLELAEKSIRGHMKLIVLLTVVASVLDFIFWYTVIFGIAGVVHQSFTTSDIVDKAFLQIINGGSKLWGNLSFQAPSLSLEYLAYTSIIVATLSMGVGLILRRRIR